MALKAVNMVPLVGADSVSPTDPVVIGLRSETATVDTGSISVSMGFSGVVHGTVIPEADDALARKIESITLQTVENRVPVGATATRDIVSGSLVITKTTNSPSDACVYAIRARLTTAASVLGYVKFRTNSAWQTQSPDWLDKTTVVCPYFCLENGQHNTALYVFLRKDGGSSKIVVGGPLLGLTAERPHETSIDVDWAALPDNSVIELWMHFNQYGPSNLPIVELWVKLPSDSGPVVKHTTNTSNLEHFAPEENGYFNARVGPDDFATLYMGNAGLTGDVLTIDDWALFPDFRSAIKEGVQSQDHTFAMVSDLDSPYVASDGKLPTATTPKRWFPVSAWSDLQERLVTPGWAPKPSHAALVKSVDEPSGLERYEPRIAKRVDGFMVEAFMSADRTSVATDQVLGAGFGVDDGEKIFQVVTVFDPTITVGVSKTLDSPGDAASYHLPGQSVDWRSRKLIRMTMDRHRDELKVEVDDETVLTLPVSTSDFPTTSIGDGKVYFGHLVNVQERGELRVSYLNYLNRYKAWEATDLDLPEVAAIPFDLVENGNGGVDSGLSTGELTIRKTDVDTAGTYRYYSRSESLNGSDGLYLDFAARVVNFNGVDSTLMTRGVWTGAGIKINFGANSMTLGFFECGVYGRKLGIIPGSGSIDDILSQTALGRAFSTSADWLYSDRYRVLYVPGKYINVYKGSLMFPPAISIPWENSTSGFDLPMDDTEASITFGHYDENTASVTAWKYIRFGQGNGQDLSVTQNFPEGLQSHHFGGKAFYLVGCSE